ncbi:MAG: hypothetical protein HY063_10760 [Bacteroidetes bacterium]|nr:hypothetical protein [Bacteroidota bacterium]
MKKTAIFLLGALTVGLLAFKVATYDTKNSTAEVDQIQGVYVFIKAKPVKEYEFLGVVKGPTFGSEQMDDMLDYMLKRVKKDYPSANGILFDGPIKRSDNTKVSAVKFKD